MEGGGGRWREVEGGGVRWREVEGGGVRWREVEGGGGRGGEMEGEGETNFIVRQLLEKCQTFPIHTIWHGRT